MALEDDLKRRTAEIKRMNDYLSSLNEKSLRQDFEIKELDDRIAEREKDFKLSEKFMTKVSELKN